MKLLGWMHRKLKHNFNEAVVNKNRTTAQTSFDDDDQKCHADPTSYEEKPLNELFHGFLAIGTLGGVSEAALFNTEPPTPTFPTSFDHNYDVTQETTQITDQQDLKLITIKLEKFLEAEEEAEDAQSSKRSSYASIITLTDKTQQDSTLLLDCPLQKYFFGSSITEAAADMAVIKNEEEEEEASLSDEDLKGNCASDKKRGNKAQFAKNFMKKMLKSLNSNSKSKTHAANGDSTHESAASTKNKFPKVLKMFKKKVHPERYIGEKEAEKNENREIPVKGSRLRSRLDPEEGLMRTSEEYFDSGKGGAFMENNEHWIKTDADYLVLEL